MAKPSSPEFLPLGRGSSSSSSGGSVKPEFESFSKKGSELTPRVNKAINDQSKAAKTYKTTDLAASDRAKASAETRKANEMTRIEKAYKFGKTEGKVKATVVAVPIIAIAAKAGQMVGKKQGTQAGHHVTTVSPKKNSMTKSERDFEAGQKLKAKELKNTGVYKNTAN